MAAPVPFRPLSCLYSGSFLFIHIALTPQFGRLIPEQREHSQPGVGDVNCSKSKGQVKGNDGVCQAWAAEESSKQEENPHSNLRPDCSEQITSLGPRTWQPKEG